jgi:hypothetical protein
VRVRVLTPVGVLDREKQLGVVRELSCAGYSYNSATVGLLRDHADMSVASSWDRTQFATSIIEEHLVHSEEPRVYNRLLAVKTEIPALYNLGSIEGN